MGKPQNPTAGEKSGGGKFSGGENFRVAVPFARKVEWGCDGEISVGRRGGEGQNFLRLRRTSSDCATPYSLVHTRTRTRTDTHKAFFAQAHRKD